MSDEFASDATGVGHEGPSPASDPVPPSADDAPSQAPEVPSDPTEFMLARMLKYREVNGYVPAAMVEAVAAVNDVSVRTVYRWISKGSRRRKANTKPRLTEELKKLYFVVNGSPKRLRDYCEEHHIECPPRETLRRWINEELSAATRAYARKGEHARRAATVYMKVEDRLRNEIWEADHKELGVKVIPPHGGKPVVPWVTCFIDHGSRAIAGVAITLYPTTADVIAAFQSAVLPDPAIGPVHGIPEEVRWDNGAEFLANAMTEILGQVGSLPNPTPAYAPHLKGRIERWHDTLDQEFLSTQPFWQGGPRAANGDVYGAKDAILPFSLLCERLLAWIRRYNTERTHSELDAGMTPAQAWESSPGTVRDLPESHRHWALLPSTTRKIGKQGIHFAGHKYVAPEVIALFGETVEIRYMPHNHLSVDVYRNGQFLCTAKVSEAMSAEDQKRFFEERQRQQREQTKLRRAATRHTKLRLTAVTTPGEQPEQATVVNPEWARASGLLVPTPDKPRKKPAKPSGVNRPWRPPGQGTSTRGAKSTDGAKQGSGR